MMRHSALFLTLSLLAGWAVLAVDSALAQGTNLPPPPEPVRAMPLTVLPDGMEDEAKAEIQEIAEVESQSEETPAAQRASAPELQTVSGRATVIDGARMRIDGRIVRLFGIDAPDLGKPHGVAAREHLARLIGTHSVLCYLLTEGADGEPIGLCGAQTAADISESVIRAGYARVQAVAARDPGIGPFYLAAQNDARGQLRGIWNPSPPRPQDKEAEQKSMVESILSGSAQREETGQASRLPRPEEFADAPATTPQRSESELLHVAEISSVLANTAAARQPQDTTFADLSEDRLPQAPAEILSQYRPRPLPSQRPELREDDEASTETALPRANAAPVAPVLMAQAESEQQQAPVRLRPDPAIQDEVPPARTAEPVAPPAVVPVSAPPRIETTVPLPPVAPVTAPPVQPQEPGFLGRIFALLERFQFLILGGIALALIWALAQRGLRSYEYLSAARLAQSSDDRKAIAEQQARKERQARILGYLKAVAAEVGALQFELASRADIARIAAGQERVDMQRAILSLRLAKPVIFDDWSGLGALPQSLSLQIRTFANGIQDAETRLMSFEAQLKAGADEETGAEILKDLAKHYDDCAARARALNKRLEKSSKKVSAATTTPKGKKRRAAYA